MSRRPIPKHLRGQSRLVRSQFKLDTSKDEKLVRVVNIRLSESMLADIDALARKNRRTRSNQMLVMLDDARTCNRCGQ